MECDEDIAEAQTGSDDVLCLSCKNTKGALVSLRLPYVKYWMNTQQGYSQTNNDTGGGGAVLCHSIPPFCCQFSTLVWRQCCQ